MTEIKQIRQQAGLSQNEASRLLEVNHRTYQRWEKGAIAAPEDVVAKLKRMVGDCS